MNLIRLHDELIEKAYHGYWGYTTTDLECHHVIPLSLGGRDHPSNWCYVPIKVHFLLHLIIFKLGATDQIFALEMITRRMKRPLRKHLRKSLNMRQQQLFREANRERLMSK